MGETLKLESIELRHVKLPYRSAFVTSKWRMTHKECVVVKLRDSRGTIGWGESVADYPFYSYESVHTNLHVMKDYLAPIALASEWPDIDAYRAAIAHVNGHNMAKGGIELALWDLFGKRAGESVRSLLGGQRDRVPVGVSVGIHDTPGELVETVARYVEQGYARVKLKIKPGHDVDEVAAVRKAYPRLLLQADGNSVYRLEDARHLARLDDYDLLLLEQPLGSDDIVDHAALAPQLKTPICLDESIHSSSDARKALQLKACAIINIKPGRVSGLTEAKAIHDYCLARGVPVWMGGMLELGIGRAGNVALATLPGFVLPGDISASERYFARDVVTPPFVLNREDSTLSAPEGAGLGVEVDEEYLEKITVHTVKLPD